MNSNILQYVCASCAAVLAVVWFLAALNEKGINPFYEIFGRYRKQTILGLLLIPILVLKAISFGSNKAPTNDVTGAGSDVTNGVPGEVSSLTNDVPGSGSAPTNAPLMMMARGGGRGATRPTEYWLWRTGTNEVWNFDLMPEAHVVESWRLRGAAEDWAVCATTNLGPVVMTTGGPRHDERRLLGVRRTARACAGGELGPSGDERAEPRVVGGDAVAVDGLHLAERVPRT